MSKHINLFALFILVISIFCSCNKNHSLENQSINATFDKSNLVSKQQKIETDTKTQLKGDFDFLPTTTTNQIVKHTYYTLSYNEKHEQAEWVAYELKKSYVENKRFQRPFFFEDSKVTTGSANWKNYKNSGYDKGHLCPAGDMSFDIDAYNDTFLTSNISPQNHNFNEGVWNRLEQKVRYWAVKYNSVYVITGGVLQNSLESIGRENVSVPKYFYKILLVNSGNEIKMIAFLVPNQISDKPLYDFVVTVDRIEEMTGIDFFPKLEDKTEEKLESSNAYKAWSFD